MDHWSLIAFVTRHALALLFAAAAVGKLRDVAATGTAAANLGVPARMSRPVAIALVVVESAVAVALVVPAIAGIGAAAALALAVAFSVLVAVQLARGRRPDCNCFGSSHASPIGAITLVRNGAIAAAAATLVVRWQRGDPCALGCPSDLSTAQVLGIVIGAGVTTGFAIHSWVLAGLLRQRGELLDRVEQLEELVAGTAPRVAPGNGTRGDQVNGRHAGRHTSGLAIGSPAPRFALADLDGRSVTIDEILSGDDPVVFLFLEPPCEACVALAAEITSRDIGGTPPTRHVIAIVNGTRADVTARIARRGFATVLVDEQGEVSQRYSVAGTPAAVLVTPRGRIGSALTEGRMPVSRLVWSQPTPTDGAVDDAATDTAAAELTGAVH